MIAPLAALLRLHDLKFDSEENEALRRREESRLLSSLSDETHRRYLQLENRFGATAIVPMDRGICRGCYVRQPAIVDEIDEDIHICQNCGRMLYDPDVAFDLSVG